MLPAQLPPHPPRPPLAPSLLLTPHRHSLIKTTQLVRLSVASTPMGFFVPQGASFSLQFHAKKTVSKQRSNILSLTRSLTFQSKIQPQAPAKSGSYQLRPHPFPLQLLHSYLKKIQPKVVMVVALLLAVRKVVGVESI